jgi:hypothetical protein
VLSCRVTEASSAGIAQVGWPVKLQCALWRVPYAGDWRQLGSKWYLTWRLAV